MSENEKRPSELQQELDKALKATFPASDPATIADATASEPERPLHRQPAKPDVELVEELARKVAEKHGQ